MMKKRVKTHIALETRNVLLDQQIENIALETILEKKAKEFNQFLLDELIEGIAQLAIREKKAVPAKKSTSSFTKKTKKKILITFWQKRKNNLYKIFC
jgi:hypothetical protein